MAVSRTVIHSGVHRRSQVDTISDHVCPRKGPSHRLPEPCRLCFRQFTTQGLLDEHYRNVRSGGSCKRYSDQELITVNSNSNRHGVSEKCEEIVENMRDRVVKAMKKSDGPPVVFDDQTMELLTKRVYSNVALYINGSDTPEKTARSELWKWYLIFKQLQPDAEVPLNPCKYLVPISKVSRSKDIQSRLERNL